MLIVKGSMTAGKVMNLVKSKKLVNSLESANSGVMEVAASITTGTFIGAAVYGTVKIGYNFVRYLLGKITLSEFAEDNLWIVQEVGGRIVGGVVGAGLGAAIGSIFGPIGTGIGAVLGGIFGSYGGVKLVKALKNKYASRKLTNAEKKRLNNGHKAYLNSLDVLGCDEDDSKETINYQKKRLLKYYHPDKNTHLSY